VFRLIAPAAKYCKPVSPEDTIFPECLQRMVDLAEAHPSVGIVGAYQVSGAQVKWQGFDYPRAVVPGARCAAASSSAVSPASASARRRRSGIERILIQNRPTSSIRGRRRTPIRARRWRTCQRCDYASSTRCCRTDGFTPSWRA